jgi:hypothetical protein
MKHFLRSFTMTALVITGTHPATAQNASGLLNRLEVQRLVIAASPDAHTALAKHFIALADLYGTDADRYAALAVLSAGNPNHPFGTDVRARRIQQAEAATAAEQTVRAVAAYHLILSIDGMSSHPAGAAAFDGGKGAPLPTRAELDELARAACTPSAERELVEYFFVVARTETANAEAYVRTARMTRVSGARMTEATAVRFDHMAATAYEAARQANLGAELHRQLATIG